MWSSGLLSIDISDNHIKRPLSDWLLSNNNTECFVTPNSTHTINRSNVIFRAEHNPWECSCLDNDETIRFIRALRDLSETVGSAKWLTTMPCATPSSVEGIDIGGSFSIGLEKIELECCDVSHDVLISSGASKYIEVMCDIYTETTHAFELSEADVTIIGIFIVILIPILLTLSPDCRTTGTSVQPSNSTVVLEGKLGMTVNNNNSNTDEEVNVDENRVLEDSREKKIEFSKKVDCSQV